MTSGTPVWPVNTHVCIGEPRPYDMLGALLRGTATVAASTLPLGAPWWRLFGPWASMSLWKSPAVQQWHAEQDPRGFHRRKEHGEWKSPRLSRRKQAHAMKRAIVAGEVALEPTVMQPLRFFKGHKRERYEPTRITHTPFLPDVTTPLSPAYRPLSHPRISSLKIQPQTPADIQTGRTRVS